jgi:hypothetical protein
MRGRRVIIGIMGMVGGKCGRGWTYGGMEERRVNYLCGYVCRTKAKYRVVSISVCVIHLKVLFIISLYLTKHDSPVQYSNITDN